MLKICLYPIAMNRDRDKIFNIFFSGFDVNKSMTHKKRLVPDL